MQIISALVTNLVLFVLVLTSAQAQATGVVSPLDTNFLVAASEANEAEIIFSKIAEVNGSRPRVREYAARIAAEHSALRDELFALASAKGILLSSSLNAERTAVALALPNLRGREFDNAYLAQMLIEHQQSVALFEFEEALGNDPDITAFSTRILPILREHLRAAERLSFGENERQRSRAR